MPLDSTNGLVHKLNICPAPVLGFSPDASVAVAWIGPIPADVELLAVRLRNTDPPYVSEFKNRIVEGLHAALLNLRNVEAWHDSDSSTILGVDFL